MKNLWSVGLCVFGLSLIMQGCNCNSPVAFVHKDTGVAVLDGATTSPDGAAVADLDAATLDLDGAAADEDASIDLDASPVTGLDASPATGLDASIAAGLDASTTAGQDAAAPVDAGPMPPDASTPCATPSQPCYTGPAGTDGVGVCHGGTQYCVAGFFGPCVGEVLPAAAESCNNLDDNCNGQTDEGLGTLTCGVGECIPSPLPAACQGGLPGVCTPKPAASAEICNNHKDDDCNGIIDDPSQCGCVFVSASGVDTNSGLAANAPLRTINAGIAVAQQTGNPKAVCVAASATCATTAATGDFTETVDMKDGISVIGGYQASATAPWPRSPNCTTRIIAPAASVTSGDRAVYFDKLVVQPTSLSGFTVNANNAAKNQAILVEGSVGAILSDNKINGGGGAESVGVRVVNSGQIKATPLITHNAITGGSGSALSAGVYSTLSAPVITRQCEGTNGGAPYDAAGRCQLTGPCFSATLSAFIRGRNTGLTTAGTASWGVRLEDSPGARISQNTICAGQLTADTAGVRITGDATGTTVELSLIEGTSGNLAANPNFNLNAVGVWMGACGGAAPWIFNNFSISGDSRSVGGRGDGVRAVGDCHPQVDSNRLIQGGEEGANADVIGVYCARDAATGISSRCTVLNNATILGSQAGFPPTATAVKCDVGACLRIENNAHLNGNQGMLTFGVVLNGASTFVNANHIAAGCAKTAGVGLLSVNAPARVQNNLIFGANGCANVTPPTSEAVRVMVAAGANEIDLHSNNLIGLGVPPSATGSCTSRTLVFDASQGSVPPTGPLGLVRNNIIQLGLCNVVMGVAELNAAADPRVFLNNDIFQGAAGQTLYLDENTTALTTIAAVNALYDPSGNSNLAADPKWTAAPNDFHLLTPSPCRDKGTAAQAPTTDYLGVSRPVGAGFDIGAIEN